MSKLTIMRGLPASGKSTRAAEIVKASGNMVRVNKDLLREMLHFKKWTGINESITRAMARGIARECLTGGINVIIDDTNLNEGTLQSWKDLAKEMGLEAKVVNMETPLEECIKRDMERENSVGEHVIIGMALKSGLYPKPKHGVVLCDLDGTLADIDHRLHFVEPELAKMHHPETLAGKAEFKKDWKGFFGAIKDDTIRTDVVDMLLKHEEAGREIFFVSARPEGCRRDTEAWLEAALKGYRIHKALFMRPEHDKREDSEVKQQMLNDCFPDRSWIVEVIDDRPRVIRMWKENGLKVIDVGKGIDF